MPRLGKPCGHGQAIAPGGTLIISSPDKAEYSDRTGTSNPFHKRELYHQEFHLLLKEHFKYCRLGKQKLVAGSRANGPRYPRPCAWNSTVSRSLYANCSGSSNRPLSTEISGGANAAG